MSDSLWPHGLQPTRLLCPWNLPGKNTGVGCHFLLHGIFPTQKSNRRLLHLSHWWADSLPLSQACYTSLVVVVVQSRLTLCDAMDCIMPGSPVLYHLPEFTQTHVHWVSDAIQASHPVVPFFSCLQSFPALGSFPVSWVFASGGQIIGASASASVLPTNIQGWFPLGLTGFSPCCPRDC